MKPLRLCLASFLLLACDPAPVELDAGPLTDAGPRVDAGSLTDAGAEVDAGSDAGATDAGALVDAGSEGDAGATDAGLPACTDDGTDDTPAAATDLGAIEDSDSYPAGNEAVVLESRSDIDWYTYTVSDEPITNVEPRVDLTGLPGGARYELCLYFECDNGLNSIGCDGAAVAHELSAERHGCCITGTGTELGVKLTPVRCMTNDESGRVFARVSQQTGEPLCTSYDLAWGDD